MKYLPWRLRYYFSLFIEADQSWAFVRLITALVTVFCFILIGRHLESVNADDWAKAIRDFFPRLNFISVSLMVYPLSYFKLAVLRHWIAPVSAIAFAIVAGTLYVQDIFEFKSFRQAWRYMVAALFGYNYPSLTVRNGQKETKSEDAPNPLDQIGGPGYLDIKLGNAVLLERGAGPTQVLGAGRHFLRRFESVRDILDLREFYRKKDEVETATKDGIKIVVRNVEATFRLSTGKKQRTEIDPYPFSVQAARAAVYDRAVNNKGELSDWANGVIGAISGRVSGWVASQRLDRLTAPTEEDPRAAIRKTLHAKEVRGQLKNMGAEPIWVNIGHLDTPDEVDSQRAATWQAFWQSQDNVTRAQGEALRVAYEELGRAEGQADMLQAIASALEDTPPDLLNERITELMLLRIARVLEAMTVEPGLSELKRPAVESLLR